MSRYLSALSVLSVLLAAACRSTPPPEPKDYAEKIAAERAAKDAQFAATDDPIPKARHKDLLPLAYFPIDPEYKVPGVLKRVDDKTVFEMPTSTGTNRQMRRVGSLEFTLKGTQLKLTVFLEVADPGHLFIAFNDLTSGTETYPSGRYIDLPPNGTNIYEVDFNRAYNPYCYYNLAYECPLPPRENRLKIPIRAGEKTKSKVES
ncbi:MAG TPA: DUF1684 domain-containing protein [Vicinamibacterales bacterium]|nr:DUF1684 domain-containing protein [Vicinamibacterales bacterium]